MGYTGSGGNLSSQERKGIFFHRVKLGEKINWTLGKNEEEFIFLEFVFYKYKLSFQRK